MTHRILLLAIGSAVCWSLPTLAQAPKTGTTPPPELYEDEPPPSPPPPQEEASRPKKAPGVEFSGQAGVVWRELSDVQYKPGFGWQLNADFTIIAPYLMLGAYFGMAKLTPTSTAVGVDSLQAIDFQTLGLRARLRIPLGESFYPYAMAGAGWVHGNFPDQDVCLTDPTYGRVCTKIYNTSTNFVEVVVGGGFNLRLADFLFLNAEVAWRPTTGYKNDVYDNAIQNRSTTVPMPTSNGKAFSAMLGITLGF